MIENPTAHLKLYSFSTISTFFCLKLKTSSADIFYEKRIETKYFFEWRYNFVSCNQRRKVSWCWSFSDDFPSTILSFVVACCSGCCKEQVREKKGKLLINFVIWSVKRTNGKQFSGFMKMAFPRDVFPLNCFYATLKRNWFSTGLISGSKRFYWIMIA